MYDDLDRLKKLFDEGTITQEEFEREKARILSSGYAVKQTGWDVGIDENSFVALMHASQFLSSFIIPLILWIMFREKSAKVDAAGKDILNFEISLAIYFFISGLLAILLIGILLLIGIGIASVILIIIAIIKALNGEQWKYPLTIQILK